MSSVFEKGLVIHRVTKGSATHGDNPYRRPMMGTFHNHEVAIPSSVRSILAHSSDDLAWILRCLRSAENVEWVSDTAPLFLAQLDHMIQLVRVIGERLDTADNAVRACAGSA